MPTYAAGQSPFGTGPADAILYRVLHEPPDLSGVSPEVRPLVEAALVKEPGQRPSAPDLLGRLTAGAAPESDPALGHPQTVLARTWFPPAGKFPPVDAKPSRPGKRRLPVLLAIAVVAALAGTGLALLTPPSANPGPLQEAPSHRRPRQRHHHPCRLCPDRLRLRTPPRPPAKHCAGFTMRSYSARGRSSRVCESQGGDIPDRILTSHAGQPATSRGPDRPQ